MDNIKLAMQGYNYNYNYNYGNGYISWARSNYGGYTYANAVEFSTKQAERLGWSKTAIRSMYPTFRGIIPKFAFCLDGVTWFQQNGGWLDNTYTPNTGDIIFFDWAKDNQDGNADHVGIVEKVEGDTVYTIEGNSGDSCRQKSYSIGYYEILGYGTPAY